MLLLRHGSNPERKLHIQHEKEKNPKGPHVNCKTILLFFVDFRRHIGASPQDGIADIFDVFSESEI